MTTASAHTRSALRLLAGAVLVLAGALPAAAAPPGPEWVAFTGCWTPVEAPIEDTSLICVTPLADGTGATLTTYTGGERNEQVLITDGVVRTVNRSGCTGTETARWSADGQRVFIVSDLECEGGVQRRATGLLSVVGMTEWIDVQAVEVYGEPAVRVRRFRPASEAALEAAGLQPSASSLAIETARRAAADALTIADVREATEHVHPVVVEALLLEKQDRFLLDADALVALADAGVPGRVIDMMIAVTYPEKFAVGAPELELDTRYGERARGLGSFWGGYDPYWDDPFYYRGGSRYGYNSYGYGGYGWWGPRSTPVIIIRDPQQEVAERNAGRAVRGRGYTRGGAPADPQSARVPSSDRSIDRATTGTRSSGSTQPARTAKPRGSGNQ